MAERAFTDLELERLIADDLTAARKAELEARATAADRTRLEELRSEHQAFLAQVDVAAEARAIRQRAAKHEPEPAHRAPWWRWMIAGGTLAAAAAAILLFVRRDTAHDEPGGDLQIKGEPVSLIVHAQDRRLAAGDIVHPGERIRFEIVAARPGYVTVVGVDGSGTQTVYYPFGATAAAAFDPVASRVLPGAIELDATPGDERFYAFFSEQAFTIDAVIPAISTARPPTGIRMSAVVLRKQP
jgi:hypothetical protein